MTIISAQVILRAINEPFRIRYTYKELTETSLSKHTINLKEILKFKNYAIPSVTTLIFWGLANFGLEFGPKLLFLLKNCFPVKLEGSWMTFGRSISLSHDIYFFLKRLFNNAHIL